MKRPLFVIGFCVFLSTAAALLLGDNFAVAMSLFLLLCAPLSLVLVRKNRGKVALLLLVVALSMGLVLLHSSLFVRPVSALAGQTVYLEGRIVSVDYYENSCRYRLDAKIPLQDGGVVRTNLLLYHHTPLAADPNEVIGGFVSLENPNLTGRYRYYYLSQRTLLTGVMDGEIYYLGGEKGKGYGLDYLYTALRQYLTEQNRVLLKPQAANMVNAMLLGEKNALSDETLLHFRRAGLLHLTAVSGFHLSVLCAILLALFGALGLGRRLGAALSLPFLFLFMAVCGFSPSVLRAGLMMGLYLLAMLLGERYDALSSLGLAMLILCLLNPFNALNTGFLLSFLCTMGVITLGPRLYGALSERLGLAKNGKRKTAAFLLRSFCISLGAYLLALPVMIFSFDSLSLIAPLASVFVMPIATLLLWLAALALLFATLPPLFGLAQLISQGTQAAAWALNALAGAFSKLPFAEISTGYDFLPIVLVICYFGAVALFFLRAPGRVKRLCAALAAVLLVTGGVSHALINRNTVRILTFSGSNTAAVVYQKTASLVGFPETMFEGRLIADTLTGLGVNSLDAAINTALSNDTGIGAIAVFERLPPKRVVMPNKGGATENILQMIPASSPIVTPDEMIVETAGLTLRLLPCSCGCAAVLDAGGINLLKIGPNCVIMDYDRQTLGVIRGDTLILRQEGSTGALKVSFDGESTTTCTLRKGGNAQE